MSNINLGPISNIAPGQGICFVVKDKKIAVFHLRDGTVAAIENTCPHKEGPLSEGITGDKKVICPLHAHKFDLETGIGSEEGEKVKTYNARIEEGNIILRLQ